MGFGNLSIFASGGGSGGGSSGPAIPKYATAANLPGSASDGDVAIVLDTNNLYSYDSGVGGWVIIGGPGVAITVTDTASVDLDLTGNVLTANLNIGATTLPANTQGLSLLIQPTGTTGLYGYFPAGPISEVTSSVLQFSGPGKAVGFSFGIQVNQSSGSTSGYLSAADWTLFNSKLGASTIIHTIAPLAGGTYLPSNGGITFTVADASASNSGVVTTGSQSFAGNKFFNAQAIGFSGFGIVSTGPETINLLSPAVIPNTYSLWLPTTPGPTFGVMQTDGMGNLSFVVGTSLPVGLTIGAFSYTSFSAGATFQNPTLTLGWADLTNPGGVGTTTQQFAGLKSFNDNILTPVISGTTAASGNLIINANSSATAGSVLINTFATGGSGFIGIGMTTPQAALHYAAGVPNVTSSAVGANAIILGRIGTNVGVGANAFVANGGGGGNRASAINSAAFGVSNTIVGTRGFAAGLGNNIAGGTDCAVFGNGNTINQANSFSVGTLNAANAVQSVAVGEGTIAQSRNSITGGEYNVAEGSTGTVVVTDPLFILGNGASSGARKNAFAVTRDGYHRWYGASAGVLSWAAGASMTGYTMVMPLAQGGTNTILRNRGDGTLDWVNGGLPNSILAFQNVSLQCTVGASALTLNLKQADGTSDPTVANPSYIGFRGLTAANGAYFVRTLTAGISLVIPAGADLGLRSGGTNGTIFAYLNDNAGDVHISVSSAFRDTLALSEATTVIGTGSDLTALYSGVSLGALPFREYAKLTYATNPAGNYTALPDTVSLVNDQAAFRPIDYIAADLTANTQTTTANTYVDVTGAALTVNAGVWDIGFDCTVEVIDVSGSGIAGTINGNIVITDSSNNIVGAANRFITTYSGDDAVRYSYPIALVARSLSVTFSETYKVRIRCDQSNTVAVVFVAGAVSQSGLTSPDCAAKMWAQRKA